MAFLPMFPLKLVVFPNEHLNLHIFEPRYQELVKDALLFGIPKFDDNKIMEYGTEMELLETKQQFASGESDVRTLGKRRFRIKTFYRKVPGKLYSGADVEYLEDDTNGDIMKSFEILDLISQLYQVLEIEKEINMNASEFQTFDMGHHVGFSHEQEYDFLVLSTEIERQDYMLKHLEKFIPTITEMKNLQERVKMNGHFKNLDPLNF